MRQPSDTCLLCNKQKATQRSSHIIPKFMGQGLFYGTSPRHAILWSKDRGKQKVQDIMKEDYILCPDCERGLSLLENYCALRLERLNKVKYFYQFRYIKEGDYEIVECKELDIKIFNLLIYSIIWRVSTSENIGFINFNLLSSD